jgi:nitrogen fixation protein FixH
MSDVKPEKQATGRGMIALVLGLLGGSVTTCVVLYVMANSDPAFAVEPDYYAKAVAWDARAAEQSASDTLGWKLSLSTRPLGERQLLVVATIVDAQGARVDGARVHLEAFANARARVPQELDLVEHDGEYHGTLSLTARGLWELRFRAERGGAVLLQTERTDLGGASE